MRLRQTVIAVKPREPMRTGKNLRHLDPKERQEWANEIADGEETISRTRLDAYLQDEAARCTVHAVREYDCACSPCLRFPAILRMTRRDRRTRWLC